MNHATHASEPSRRLRSSRLVLLLCLIGLGTACGEVGGRRLATLINDGEGMVFAFQDITDPDWSVAGAHLRIEGFEGDQRLGSSIAGR